MTRIAPLLRAQGIEFRRHRHGQDGTRLIELRCTSEAAYDELRARVLGRRSGAGDQPAR